VSWSINVLLVQLETPEKGYEAFVNKLGIGNATYREKLPFDDAIDEVMDADGVAIASAEGWTSVWGSLISLIVGDDVLAELSATARTYSFMLDGTSDSYIFETWVKGKRVRKRGFQDGEVFVDEGEPLPEEAAAFANSDDEEDRAFGLMNKLSVPHRRLTKPKFHVFDVDE
jgi:hypothetical protein